MKIELKISPQHKNGFPGIKVNGERALILLSKDDYNGIVKNMRSFCENTFVELDSSSFEVPEVEVAKTHSKKEKGVFASLAKATKWPARDNLPDINDPTV